MKRVTCFPEKSQGKLRAQHGMCNWLKLTHCAEGSPAYEQYLAMAALLQQIDPPMTRIKYFYSRGYGKSMDVPFIFHDFRKDAEDPRNYYFSVTDTVLKELCDIGKPFIYHLGPMRENWSALYTKRPEDYEKYATVCLNIVRHINKGWAKGLRCGVKYWEIWGRADDPHCWSGGSYEDYYRLYEAVARKIKAAFPRLKVGGPASADVSDPAFLQGFLDYVTAKGVPCDFVSWNYYGTDAAEAGRLARQVKTMVRKAGLKVPVFNTEWNALELDGQGIIQCPDARNMKGAAFDAAFMLQMEKAGMELCTYYDAMSAAPWGALYETCWYTVNKPIYSFVAFARLYALQNRMGVKTVGKDVYAAATQKDGKFALLVSVCQDKRDTLALTLPAGKKQIKLLDETHDLEVILETEEQQLTLPLRGQSVVLVESV